MLTCWLVTAAQGAYGGYGGSETPTPDPVQTEPVLPAGLSGQKGGYDASEDEFPYYGNVPDPLIPFRNVEPFHRYWTTRLPFLGPGADFPDPVDLKALKVGLLSPNRKGPEGARGERTRQGVELAFEEANAHRTTGQLPFELVQREDSPQWGSAANIAVEFKDEGVLGFLGTVDGDATHVALRVALKIETYIINTSDPDPTLTETRIPWLTRVLPDERQQSVLLADLVVRQHDCKRIVVFRESSRPGRVGVMQFINFIRRLGRPPVQHLFFLPGSESIEPQIAAIKGANPDAICFYGPPEDIGRFARMFREAGLTAKFFGFDRLHDDSFRQQAGSAAEGTTIAYYFDPDRQDAPWLDFAQRYENRWHERPDIYAAYGYDGANLMIEAIREVGPNRFRIRDYLANLKSWEGVTGPMVFDGRWDNIAPMWTAQLRNGQWHFTPPKTTPDTLTRN